MTPSLLLALEALRLFGAGFFYFTHAALAALGAVGPLGASLALAFRLLAEPLLAFLAGVWADRWPRPRLLVLAALGQGLFSLALFLTGTNLPLLYLLGFLFGGLEVVRMVAVGALFAGLLPFLVLRSLGEAPWVLGLLGSLGSALGGFWWAWP